MVPVKKLLLLFLLGGVNTVLHADGEEVLAGNTIKIIERAFSFVSKNSLDTICSSFAKKEQWKENPIELFIFDVDGTCFIDQGNVHRIWQRVDIAKDFFDEPLLATMVAHGSEGGWVTYVARNSFRHVYVKTFIKQGKTYVLGAGFFDHSPNFIAKLIVEAIRKYWQHMPFTKLFDIVSNYRGPLAVGNIYGIVIDDTGLCWAHGNNSLLIGQNLTDPQNSPDYQLFKKALEITKTESMPLWIEFKSRGHKRRAYVEPIIDPKSKRKFIILSGYYMAIDEDLVKDLAQKTSVILKSKNVDEALVTLSRSEMESSKVDHGDLSFMVVDDKGIIRVYSFQPQAIAYVGRYVDEYVDQKGRSALKMIFDRALANGEAWVSRFNRNSLERLYGIKVTSEKKAFVVITTNYYPFHDQEIAKIIAHDTFDFLTLMKSVTDLSLFTQPESPFIKGPISIALYNKQGYCWLQGLEKQKIWKHDKDLANLTEGWIDDERSHLTRRELFKKFDKKLSLVIAEDLMICCGFYKIREGKA